MKDNKTMLNELLEAWYNTPPKTIIIPCGEKFMKQWDEIMEQYIKDFEKDEEML